MDDQRLKNPPGPGQRDYFDERLDRIREIRASERRFDQKVLDIYATSVGYDQAHVPHRAFRSSEHTAAWRVNGARTPGQAAAAVTVRRQRLARIRSWWSSSQR